MRISIILILLLSILACSQHHERTTSSLNGVWQSDWSGSVLHIKDDTSFCFYDITSISCLPNKMGHFKELKDYVKLNNDELSLRSGVTEFTFKRIDHLPALCDMPLSSQKQADPIYNFEVFAETVKEHYAFFALNGINWNELYNEQKSKLSSRSANTDLYLVIEETLEELNDNHRFLEATPEVYDELEVLNQEVETEAVLPQEIGDFQVANMVAKHHIHEDMTEDSWLISWGKMTNNIGFIQVKTMWLYADVDIPQALEDKKGFVDAFVETRHKLYEGIYIQKEIEGVKKVMDKVMKDLSDTESIVIDVRFNGGGQDAVSFEILSRFTTQRTQVATQKLRFGSQFSPIQPFYIEGSDNPYTKPVYVLCSPQTGSAAEAFSIATLGMKNIKRIGSATQGALSTSLERILPNGWSFAMSNEIYMDNEGESYENKGVPIDYELNYSRDRQTFFSNIVNDLQADKRSILKAIEVLRID